MQKYGNVTHFQHKKILKLLETLIHIFISECKLNYVLPFPIKKKRGPPHGKRVRKVKKMKKVKVITFQSKLINM